MALLACERARQLAHQGGSTPPVRYTCRLLSLSAGSTIDTPGLEFVAHPTSRSPLSARFRYRQPVFSMPWSNVSQPVDAWLPSRSVSACLNA